MARDVTVRLSADIAAYVQAMSQAEHATARVADAADRLSNISISADSSVASDLDQAASSADAAASSMEQAGGAAESMSGGMDSAGASAQSAAGGLQEAGAASENVAASVGQVSASSQQVTADMLAVSASAQNAAGGMESAGASAASAGAGLESAGASALVFSSNLDGSGGSAQTFASSLSTVGAQSQTVAADLQAAGAAAQVMSSNLDGSGGSAQNFAASLSTVGAQSQDAAGAMQDLAGSAQSASAGLDTAAGTAGSASGSFGDLLSTASGAQSEFRALGGAMTVVGGGLTAMAGSVLGVGIAYNNLQQVSTQALSVMTDSASDAAAQMDRFDAFARNSPFFRNTWLEAQRQLMAFGMEAERVVPTLEGIEEAVAAIGGGDQEIRQLVDILGQIEGQGRITGRELQRMGQMGIDAASIMGTQLGMTGDEIRTQITAGAIDARTAIDALAAGMSEQFAGSGDAIRNTFEGAKNDVIAFVRDIGSIIAAPLVNPEGGGFLVDIMNMAGDALLALRDLPAPLIQIAGLGAAAAGGITLIGGGLVAALPHLRNFATNAGTAWSAIGSFATGGAGVAGAVRRIGTAVGIAAAAWAAWEIVSHIGGDVDDFVGSLSDMERALLELSQGQRNATQDLVEFERGWSLLGTSVEGLGGAMERIDADRFLDGFRSFGASILPITNDISAAEEAVARFDEATANAFSEGNFKLAAAGFQEVAAEAERLGLTADEVAEMYPQMTAAIRDAATAAGSTATDQQLLGIATSEAALAALHAGESWSVITQAYRDNYYAASNAGDGAIGFRDALSQQAEAAKEAADSLQSLLGYMSEYAGIALEAEATTDQWLADLRDLNGVLDEGEFSLNKNTDAGKENRAMLRDLASDTWDVAAATAAQGGSLSDVNGVIDTNIEALRSAGEAAGLTEGEIDDMIRTYMGFNEVEPIEVQAENRAQEIFDEVEAGLNSLPDDFTIWLEAQDERAQETIAALLEGDYEAVAKITGDAALAQAVVEAFESGDYRAVAELIAEDDAAQEVLYNFETGQYEAQVDILGNDDPAREIVAAIMNGDYQALVDILGGEDQATEAIMAIQDGDYQALVDAVGGEDRATEVLNLIANNDYIAQIVAEALSDNAEGELNNTSRDRNSMITGFPLAEGAEAVLNETSRDRIATVLADPDAWNAEGVLNETARQRIADILAQSHTGIAESDLNGAARQRIADILARPDTYTAEGELTNTARQRIADILAQPSTWTAESDLNNTSRSRTAPINADARTAGAEARLNWLARSRTAIMNVKTVGGGIGGGLGRAFKAAGGRADASAFGGLPAFSSGGRLRSTGLGTDSILGISRSGTPTAWVDDREWIINQRASDKYDRALAAINADHPSVRHLAGYADGGRARSFASSGQVQATPAIDYSQLANAMASGPRVVFQQTNHNPLRETDIEAARRQVEAVGMDWDMSGVGGDL